MFTWLRIRSYTKRTNAVIQEIEMLRQEIRDDKVQSRQLFDRLGNELQEIRDGIDRLCESVELLAKRMTDVS